VGRKKNKKKKKKKEKRRRESDKREGVFLAAQYGRCRPNCKSSGKATVTHWVLAVSVIATPWPVGQTGSTLR
jgi:CO/xanthine dehydrogenase Mo-binding subunit